ncbi:unnamed protein product, partial [Polarella glacialis]
MMCRDELAAKGIAMNTIADWQKVHGRCPTPEAPVRLLPAASGLKAKASARVEEKSPNFGRQGLRCGQAGWLQTESLEGWFKRFGKPIATDSDVRRLAGSLMRPPLDLSGDRKLDRMRHQPWRKRNAKKADEDRGLTDSSDARGFNSRKGLAMLFPKSYMDKEGETGTSIGGRVKPLIARDFMVIAVFAFGGYAVSFLNQKFVACPHLAQIRRAAPPPPHVGALLAAALYGANIAYNVMNKRLLLAHPCPLSVTTMNFGTASMCCMLAWGLGVQKPAKLTRELC